MDSKRLFIFIALWLILSCVLLDHAKGFIQPRKMRKYKQRKRGPKNHLGRNTKELIALVSQIWTKLKLQAPTTRTPLNPKFKLHSTASPKR